MRISTGLMQALAVNGMTEQQSNLANTQIQLASGLRINQPADDPAGAVQAQALNESIAVTNQYQTNITLASSRLSQEDSTLQGIDNALQQLNGLALQGANDSLTASDRQSIAVQANQILGQVKDLMNTKTDSGEFLFSGFNSNTPPYGPDQNTSTTPPTAWPTFVYQGDNGRRLTMTGAINTINDNDPGSAIFNIDTTPMPPSANSPTATTIWPPAVPANVVRAWNPTPPPSPPTTGPTVPAEPNLLNVIYNFVQNMQSNTPDSMDIERIQRAMSQVVDARVTVGARLSAVNSQQNQNDQFITDEKSYLSSTQDLNYASAISQLNLQQVALQASQAAYAKVQGLSLFKYI